MSARKPPVKKPPPAKRAVKAKAAPAEGAKAAARRGLERAKRSGAIGPHGTRAQRALRDGAIVAALAAGHTSAEVAAEVGVSTRTIKSVKAASLVRPSMLEETSMAIVEGLVRSLRDRIARFEMMAFHHADRNPSVAASAMKGAAQAEERMTELLMSLGKLPSNLALFQAESVLRAAAQQMAEAMVAVRAGELSVEDAWELFDAIQSGRERAPQLGVPA